MRFGTLLDQTALSANLLYLHRGVIPPGAGIGHHFHNTIEEMYIILDNEAEFTVDGRTSLLSGVVGAPCRMGHSHAIYNSSDRPTEWLNIGVSSRKNIGDAFDLDDDRVGVAMDPKPVFMTVRLEPGYASGDDPVRVRRALGAGVFSGPWEYLDYVILEGGSEYAVGATEGEEQFVFVLAGDATAEVVDEEVELGTGDVLPVRRGERCLVAARKEKVQLIVVGIAL